MTHSPLLLQLILILATARVLALVLRHFGQPPVISEMIAGLMLGPLVFGALAPQWSAFVFEPGSLAALEGLAQLGLVLFMFIVGAEIRLPRDAGQELKAAVSIGVGSVVLPMALGIAAAVLLYERFAPAGVPLLVFALFLASAMSITAFPIMARILKERGMTQSEVGRLSLSSAAIADVLAWIVLGFVVALAGSGRDWARFQQMLIGVAALVALVFVLLRPAVAWLVRRYAVDGSPQGALLAVLLLGTFGCAYATELLGVHPVFGAFLFGASLPRDDRLLHALIERIQHVAILILMPVFFALAGLNTSAEAFADTGLAALSLILVVAIVGKIAGGALGARLAGREWRTALAIGSLMNARALMELIVMKVGLDIGVIGSDLFTMLFIMAILTTMMTGPLLTFFSREAPAAAVDRTSSSSRTPLR